MTNTEMLNGLIREKGFKKVFLAEKCGLSPVGFHNCVTNKAEFKASQINILCDLLGITDLKQKEEIFFAGYGAY